MATQSLRGLAAMMVVAVAALALAACSDDEGGSSAGAAPSPSESSPASATPTGGEVCTSLADVRSAAEAIKSDVQAKQLAALTTDIPALGTAVDDLLHAMATNAQQDVDDVQSAWTDVKDAFAGVDKSDLGQARSTLRGPVDQLKSTLESLGSDQGCP